MNIPVNTIDDNLSWIKGNHTISLGGNWRGIQNNTANDTNSYNGANYQSVVPECRRVLPIRPQLVFRPSIRAFETSFDYAYATITRHVAERDSSNNYMVTSPTTATLLPDGAFISRHFKTNEFEYFLQDSWRISRI